MTGAHRVSLDDLVNVVDRLASFERTLEESFDQADAQARGLHATWSGAAAAAHQEIHARWRAGAAEMHAALITMRAIAHAAHDNYTAAGNANATMWSL